MDTKEQMAQARAAIEAKDYKLARRILRDVHEPNAREWEARLNQIDPPKPSNAGVWVFVILVILFAVIALGVFWVQQTAVHVQATMDAARLGTGVP